MEELLMRFGLTRQEAQLYAAMHSVSRASGYELAKLAGISRSNAYTGLANLVEKGAAYLIEGKPARYEAVPAAEFCRNSIRGLQAAARELERRLAAAGEPETAYLTIKGADPIRDKVFTMILQAKHRIYLALAWGALEQYVPELARLAEQGKKVVVITDRALSLQGAQTYLSRELDPGLVRVIVDSTVALTGGLDNGPHCSCLYSRQENLVRLLKDSIKHEIILLRQEEARAGNGAEKEERTERI